ncbi:hypothetical protein ABIE44_002932 [Marmoricola sp. OAE513]|uniref:FG-GAP-like repeat-containing protein n=1 Tax=Marmoricola sp. OAE513 TaxID=2817894 RepID=UPI001AE53184
MRTFRARYITICQQILVTAVVVAVGLSAAGVMTLQIVAPENESPVVDGGALGMAPAIDVTDGYAATKAVTPKVREIKVAPVAVKAPARKRAQAPAKKADAGRTLAAVSKPEKVHGYATVGVTWKAGEDLAEDDIEVQVRTRKNGAWSGWTTAAYHDEHGPDAGTGEAERATRPGTDAVVIGDVDAVQMRAETADGTAPDDLELAVIDPGTAAVTKEPAAIDTAELPASDRDATSSAPIESTAGMEGTDGAATHGDGAAASSDLELAAMKVAPKPTIYSRAQWGANEKLRDKSSLRYGTVQTGFIHHTVNANNYTAEQVPALLRGIYAYHTQSRGWSDIGYNYLVDRFGRIWEGRYGGVDRAVVGAHTLGYNEYAFAMSAIGNFDIAQPPQAVLDAYAKLFAWKLSLYNIRADASGLTVKGKKLFAINGHRDVGKTACPGKYLYAKIPSIRVAAQTLQNKAQVPVDPVNRAVIAAPKGLVAPTAKPTAAVPQPRLTLPVRRNLAGSAWADLIVKSASGVISVVPTEGVLSYAGPIISKGSWSDLSIIAAAGDLTGDGKADVVGKIKKSGAVRVFPGDGAGHVSRAGVGRTMAFDRVKSIVGVKDFTRDGRNDVVGVDKKTSALLLYRGLGKGTFAPPVVLKKSWPYTKTAGVGDFNGDKQADLMVVSGDRTLYLVPGAAKGTKLGKPVRLGALAAPVSALLGWGDLTGDKKADIVVKDTGTGLGRIRSGLGNGRVGTTYGPFESLRGLTKITMAPMVGTVAADAVGRDAAGRLVVVPNNGRRNISAPLPSNLKVPAATQILSVGDWDKDGKSDVVVRLSEGNALRLYPGLGNGKFGQPRSLGLGWKSVNRLAAVGDVTGDGFPDLIGKIGSGPLTIFPGNGTKAFKAPTLAPASLRTFNQIGSAAWSPRGAAFTSSDGSFVPLAGGALGTALRAANGTATPVYDTYVGVGDANGDGVADLLAREKGSGTLWLLPGKTSGGFAPRVWVATGFAGYQLLG